MRVLISFTLRCVFLADNAFKVPAQQPSTQPQVPSSTGNYELATHTVKVRRTGALADVMAIWDLPGSRIGIRAVDAVTMEGMFQARLSVAALDSISKATSRGSNACLPSTRSTKFVPGTVVGVSL